MTRYETNARTAVNNGVTGIKLSMVLLGTKSGYDPLTAVRFAPISNFAIR